MSPLAWSGSFGPEDLLDVTALPLPGPALEWAVGGATGRGVKLGVIDSGVDGGHPRVGGLAGGVSIETAPDGSTALVEGSHSDLVGHGTACAAIVRMLAPEVEMYSIRVLGTNLRGKGSAFVAGIRWALDAGMDVINMSLSSKSEHYFGPLHDIADEAYFHNVMLVCAANNVPGPTYPSQYSSVISVAARPGTDPFAIDYNPHPPVEYGARGIDVDVAWMQGGSTVATGNSFAAPHVSGLVALLLSKHPGLTPFQVKSVLQAAAGNAR